MNPQHREPAWMSERPVNTPASRIPERDRTTASILHLSVLAMFVLPTLGQVIGPLLVWLAVRGRSEALDEQGKELINFQISLWIYTLVITGVLFLLGAMGFLGIFAGAAAASPFMMFGGTLGFVGSMVLLGVVGTLLGLLPLLYMVLGAMAAGDGRLYRYPLTIRLIK